MTDAYEVHARMKKFIEAGGDPKDLDKEEFFMFYAELIIKAVDRIHERLGYSKTGVLDDLKTIVAKRPEVQS